MVAFFWRGGGDGGLIRDNLGNSILVHLMKHRLIRCLWGRRQLKTLRGYNALIEGDSFFYIQWGSAKVDWSEEIWYISSQLNLQFYSCHS